ncbi:hypothetical protein AGMMS50225_26450 [Betaproteobacteria bacterium]|nr:hypothetical protein AGMMS50225_26450 [Betaproteobacteria bacterium]
MHQAHEVDDAGGAIEVALFELELVQEEFAHRLRAVVGDFEAHGVAVMALVQLAGERGAQILDLLFVDEEIGIARDAELIAAVDAHAAEQLVDVVVQHRGQEHEGAGRRGDGFGQEDDAGQGAGSLDDGRARIAPEGVAPLQLHGEVEALVEHAGEGMRGVEPDRGEHRHHLAVKIILDPLLLRFRPRGAAQKHHPFAFQRGQDVVVEQGVLPGNEAMNFRADPAQQLRGRHPVVAHGAVVRADLFADAGDANLEKFVEVARYDAQKAQTLQQGHRRVSRLGEHPALELQQGDLAVDEVFSGIVGFVGRDVHVFSASPEALIMARRMPVAAKSSCRASAAEAGAIARWRGWPFHPCNAPVYNMDTLTQAAHVLVKATPEIASIPRTNIRAAPCKARWMA